MNLREFVAILEAQKPEASEHLMMAMQAQDGLPLGIKSLRVDDEADTVWLIVEET